MKRRLDESISSLLALPIGYGRSNIHRTINTGINHLATACRGVVFGEGIAPDPTAPGVTYT